MSTPILIIGKPGSGKSASLRTLDPKTTFLISIIGKSLPFKSYRNNYKPIKGWDDKEGNCYATDDWVKIIKCIQMIDKLRPDITTLIIDDWQYVMSHEFMRRAHEKGYDKFTEMALHAWETIQALKATRGNLTNFVMAHCETDPVGFSRIKTIGKLLSEKLDFEGMFEITLHTRVMDGAYLFQTQQDGEYLARAPMDMFDNMHIPNDLLVVKQAFESYYNDGETA